MQVGDRITTWFSARPDGKSTIVAIHPYTGRYPQHFTHVLVLTAPRTYAGTLEMSVKEEDINLELETTQCTAP